MTLAGTCLAANSSTGEQVMMPWQQELARHADWTRRGADGTWNYGVKNLSAATRALTVTLGQAVRVKAAGNELRFASGDLSHRIALHFIA